MLKSDLYKCLQDKLIMGAHEALMLLGVLQKNGTLTREYCVRHVLSALYQGPDVLYGEPSYENAERAACAGVFRNRRLSRLGSADVGVRDAEISPEAADYLRQILATAAGDRKEGLSPFAGRFDGYSEEAYEEVIGLLGRHGCRYLGISGPGESLMPARNRIFALVSDESYARRKEPGEPTGPEVLMLDIEKGQPPDLYEEIKLSLSIPENEFQPSNLWNMDAWGMGTHIGDINDNTREYKVA